MATLAAPTHVDTAAILSEGKHYVLDEYALKTEMYAKVKQAFLDGSRFERLSKKPIVASSLELDENPRSRSAKLRAARLLPPSWSESGQDTDPSAA